MLDNHLKFQPKIQHISIDMTSGRSYSPLKKFNTITTWQWSFDMIYDTNPYAFTQPIYHV